MDNQIIAFYLPQFHEIPENNKWWGKGFTEWINVRKAKPLFKNHYQPKIPGELGYYNLSDHSVMERQAEMAIHHRISGFCFYHYWFGNRVQLLEKPIERYLDSISPDFPFVICWANETWSGIWHGAPGRILQNQVYPGKEDIKDHAKYLMRLFEDERYIKIDGRPVFIIHSYNSLPEDYWGIYEETFYKDYGVELYAIAGYADYDNDHLEISGLKGKVSSVFLESRDYLRFKGLGTKILYRLGLDHLIKPRRFDFEKITDWMINTYRVRPNKIPVIVPNWDTTPRVGKDRGEVLINFNSRSFINQIKTAMKISRESKRKDSFVFLKSWNEWAEGNYVEPDDKNGYLYLESIRDAVTEFGSIKH